MKSICVLLVVLMGTLSPCSQVIQAQNSLEPTNPSVTKGAIAKSSFGKPSDVYHSPYLSLGYNVGLASWSKSFYQSLNDQLNLEVSPAMHNLFVTIQTVEASNLSMRIRGDFSFSPSSNNRESKSLRQMAFAVGLDFRYKFIQTSMFELAGTVGAGVQASTLDYKNYSGTVNDSLLSPPLILQEAFTISQKFLGYAAVGVEAFWRATPYLGLGVFVRWRQQIGHGYWYKDTFSREAVRVSDLPKYTLNPLEMGIVLSLTRPHSKWY